MHVTDDKHSSSLEFLYGILVLALITFTAVGFHVHESPPRTSIGPGTISLLYLIVVVFVSLRAGFIFSVAVPDSGLLPELFLSSPVLGATSEEPSGHCLPPLLF
jgi:hypothetical protein